MQDSITGKLSAHSLPRHAMLECITVDLLAHLAASACNMQFVGHIRMVCQLAMQESITWRALCTIYQIALSLYAKCLIGFSCT